MDTTLAVVRDCGDDGVQAGRNPMQQGWYEFARRYVKGKMVLDAGCGLGPGLPILRSEAALVHGQDLDSRLAAPDVLITPVEKIADKSYDVVLSIDVVEHVPDPEGFVHQLVRIAREGVFITTPNWTASRCQWHYHLREYMPHEFYQLLAPHGHTTLFKGTSTGYLVHCVRHPQAYFVFNKLRTWTPTSFPARCLNVALPSPYKIHSHHGAWICLTGQNSPV